MDRRAWLAGAGAMVIAQAAGATVIAQAAGAAETPSRTRRPYRRIACEEGFLTQGVLAQNAKTSIPGVPLITAEGPAAALARPLLDIGAGRIAAMDADGVDVQLLLLASPGVQVFEAATATALAREANDMAAAACRAHPTRLAALAACAPQDPQGAAREIERAVTRLGLKGAIINSHTGGDYLDLPRYTPIWKALAALDVPLYIHPREPAAAMREVMAGPVVGGAAWAYGVEVGTHVLRLIQSGLFDRFPTLKVVVGHMGEALPFWLPRIDNRYEAMRGSMFGGAKPMQRMPSAYLRRNLWITTSGMNYWPQLRMTREVMGADRVLYATDYPFERQGEAIALAEALPMTVPEKRAFFETNAAGLFRL